MYVCLCAKVQDIVSLPSFLTYRIVTVFSDTGHKRNAILPQFEIFIFDNRFLCGGGFEYAIVSIALLTFFRR